MKYLSLFSGIGGFELGIQQAYESKQNQKMDGNRRQDNTLSRLERQKHSSGIYTSQTNSKNINDNFSSSYPTCIGYSEIDKYAIQIYEKHFNHKNYGDITKVKAEDLPEFDLIVGGFPCQSFSIAGKRGGFNDTRGTLFFEIARIIKVKQPRLLLLENVKGLLSHDEGRTFATIISTLDELGYDLQWQVLNSKNFGVPQNRERVFIIGHLRGTSRPKVFPIREDQRTDNKSAKLRTGRKLLQRDKSKTVQEKEEEAISKPSGQIARTEWNKPNDSDSRGGQAHPVDYRIRRLTPTECERLQGFPDDWTEGVSDTQRYKCLGNAVTVNVIKAIAQKLL